MDKRSVRRLTRGIITLIVTASLWALAPPLGDAAAP